MYRRYVTLHLGLTCAAFAIAAVWIIISAVRHSTAQSNCEETFFPSGDSPTSTLGQTMCNIFAWVDVGLMGAAWVFFAVVQVRFVVLLVTSCSIHHLSRAISMSLCLPTALLKERITRSMMYSITQQNL